MIGTFYEIANYVIYDMIFHQKKFSYSHIKNSAIN